MEHYDELLELLASTIRRDIEKEYAMQGYTAAAHEKSKIVEIKHGKKYTKIDVGNSGRYMVDLDGNIFGIKGYGVIHKGHCYGTLHTIGDWYWGGYKAVKINVYIPEHQ